MKKVVTVVILVLAFLTLAIYFGDLDSFVTGRMRDRAFEELPGFTATPVEVLKLYNENASNKQTPAFSSWLYVEESGTSETWIESRMFGTTKHILMPKRSFEVPTNGVLYRKDLGNDMLYLVLFENEGYRTAFIEHFNMH